MLTVGYTSRSTRPLTAVCRVTKWWSGWCHILNHIEHVYNCDIRVITVIKICWIGKSKEYRKNIKPPWVLLLKFWQICRPNWVGVISINPNPEKWARVVGDQGHFGRVRFVCHGLGWVGLGRDIIFADFNAVAICLATQPNQVSHKNPTLDENINDGKTSTLHTSQAIACPHHGWPCRTADVTRTTVIPSSV